MLLRTPEAQPVMQQPESKFKEKLVTAFCDLTGGKRHPDSFYFYIIANGQQRAGVPDLFFTALGGHAWVEAKVHPNTLSEIQLVNMTRMRRGGSRAMILTISSMEAAESHRKITVALLPRGSEMWSETTYPWESMTTLTFWKHLLGVAHG